MPTAISITLTVFTWLIPEWLAFQSLLHPLSQRPQWGSSYGRQSKNCPPGNSTSTSRFSFSRKFFLLSSPTCSFWPSFKKSLSLNVGRSLACNKKPVSNSQNPYFLGEGWYTDPLVVFWLHRDSDRMWGCTRTFCLFIRWSGSSCPLSMQSTIFVNESMCWAVPRGKLKGDTESNSNFKDCQKDVLQSESLTARL